MKKRIFISMHYMEIGGAESALIGLLQSIDYSRYDVDLFLHAHRGEMMQFIPKEVNLLPEIKEYAHIECSIKQVLKDGCWGILLARLMAKWQFRKYLRRNGLVESSAIFHYIAVHVSPYLPDLHELGVYDLAVSFHFPHNYVIDKVQAKKKICWIHTDYTRIDIDMEQELPVWNAFDKVVSISPDVTRTFLQVFPPLKDKIVEMENILSSAFVRSRAEEFDAAEELAKYGDGLKLLSVGRFCEAKNYDNIPDICRRLLSRLSSLNNSLSLKWFLIGYGGMEELIRKKIKEVGMEENVIILGKRSNPYPYMAACDIYVQPSRYEGKSVTVREAQMLCKPVVVTNYATAFSQIQDNIDGCIVPMDNEGCANGLTEFVLNKELQQKITDYQRKHDYGNESEIRIFYKLM